MERGGIQLLQMYGKGIEEQQEDDILKACAKDMIETGMNPCRLIMRDRNEDKHYIYII